MLLINSVQKEILQILIDLYIKSNYKPIKGEEIAAVMERNPGTIRNQMQSLGSLGIVKGVPGPRGGYKPTIDAYNALNITTTDEDTTVPLYKEEKKIENLSVTKIEFSSIPHPGECKAKIKVMGDIKQLDLGDKIRVGPSPINKLILNGRIIGRDDIDSILLLEVREILSIPHKAVSKIFSRNLITLEPDMDIKEAAWILSNNGIDGAPVTKNQKLLGILTLIDITKAIANNETNLQIKNLMSKYIITIQKETPVSEAMHMMNKNKIGRLIIINEKEEPIGIITKTDLLNQITGMKYLSSN